MQSVLFQNNIALLRNRNPALAESLASLQPGGNYAAVPSRTGPPSLSRVLPTGGEKALHSRYDPLLEAARFAESCPLTGALHFVFFGFGLGYHAFEVARRVPPQSRLYFVEKDIESFHMALTCNDCAPVLTHPGASFHIGRAPGEWVAELQEDLPKLALTGYVPIAFPPLVESEKAYYRAAETAFEAALRQIRIDFKTQAAFAKKFYANIIDNLPRILASPGINQFENKLNGVPAVVISAGPSLDKNVRLLKGVRDNAVLIAVATALRPLLDNGVEPDFAVAIDPDESMRDAFDMERQTEKTWLLYDPGVPPEIPALFGERSIVFDSNIYLSRWIAQHNGGKGSLGKTQSVAHAALKFALRMGCGPVFLAGQDLAFDGHRLHCSGSHFNRKFLDEITPFATLERLNLQHRGKYASAASSGLDLFGAPAAATLAMESYKNIFAEEFKDARNIRNATEGGIPIPGFPNLCLGEALYVHCGETQARRKEAPLKNLPAPSPSRKLMAALQAQTLRFEQVARRTAEIAHRADGNGSGDPAGFVAGMGSLLKFLLDDPDTLQLLQGYAYSGFMQWNQASNEIERKVAWTPEADVLMEKYQRDRRFAAVLMESAEYLRGQFSALAEKVGKRGL
ncbi:MAG: motility associated factor glycosyltransferase family protein [Nitrospinae bacterium]|nr:motility associated factor glycosyltransferase family protein [Nitrospinota bacterium]